MNTASLDLQAPLSVIATPSTYTLGAFKMIELHSQQDGLNTLLSQELVLATALKVKSKKISVIDKLTQKTIVTEIGQTFIRSALYNDILHQRISTKMEGYQFNPLLVKLANCIRAFRHDGYTNTLLPYQLELMEKCRYLYLGEILANGIPSSPHSKLFSREVRKMSTEIYNAQKLELYSLDRCSCFKLKINFEFTEPTSEKDIANILKGFAKSFIDHLPLTFKEGLQKTGFRLQKTLEGTYDIDFVICTLQKFSHLEYYLNSMIKEVLITGKRYDFASSNKVNILYDFKVVRTPDNNLQSYHGITREDSIDISRELLESLKYFYYKSPFIKPEFFFLD